MQGVGAKITVALSFLVTLLIGGFGLYGLLTEVFRVCVVPHPFSNFIPILPNNGGPSSKYGLYLYQGLEKIDFSGVPVLFIPGSGGSYKQVRSIAAECDRAFQGGPLERNFYQEVHLTPEEGGLDVSLGGFKLPNQYASRLNWFAVDLEGEPSAFDGRILEEHIEYVVYAIHTILDQYKESHSARAREGSVSLPRSVILVGHSMGGFVARAAIVHPQLRKSAVETVLTLATPHQSPPLAFQPSLGQIYTLVNQKWKKGYEIQTGHMPNPLLSNVVVVSVSGGHNDYQVRSKLESLNDIVPSTHGFMISSTGMKNVWLSMEHQAIVWCNQLIVQVSHTLLSLIDSKTAQPFPETTKRLAVFSRMLRSGIPETFNWMGQSHLTHDSVLKWIIYLVVPVTLTGNNDDALERDLYIHTTSMTVLTMDGRRRWMDIQNLSSNGKSHFIFVTNLAPCFGVRLHLRPEKEISTSEDARIVEVTSKLVQIASLPAPRQVETVSQTEQVRPSSVLQLSPEDMRGFRFLTISVAPHSGLSSGRPPAASMAVGQFFNPEEGKKELSSLLMLFRTDSQKVAEDHPIAFSLSFPISLGLLPVTVSLKTTECGLRKPDLHAEEMDNKKVCESRCFPPVALAWNPTLGLHIFPNFTGESIIVDSSPPIYMQSSTETVLLLTDPHCSYKMSFAVSMPAAASRVLLLYNSQIVGFCMVIIFLALAQLANPWDRGQPIPTLLTAVESNLRKPLLILTIVVNPIFFFFTYSSSLVASRPLPSFVSFSIVALMCYLIANGSTILLIYVSQYVFYAGADIHDSIRNRWQRRERRFCLGFLNWLNNLYSKFSSLRVVRLITTRLDLLLATVITLGFLTHPAFGLFILVLSHAICCHNALSRHANSLGPTKSDNFNHWHGLFVLHLLAALTSVPSLVAWFQRKGFGLSFPWFWDSIFCIGVVLHGVFNARPERNSTTVLGIELGLELVYYVAAYCSYILALFLEPYQVFYAIAGVGLISFVLRVLQRNVERGEPRFGRRERSL